MKSCKVSRICVFTFILKALSKAEDQYKKILEQYQEERFGCLAYYGIGKVYLRQNRLV